jgi:iron complex outermembrane receptor protein
MLSSILLFFNILTSPIQGVVQDSITGEAISEVRIQIKDQNYATFTDGAGQFSAKLSPGTYTFVLQKEGYVQYERQVVIGDSTKRLILLMIPKETISQEVVVRAVRAPRSAPITQQNIGREEIERRYFGHDVPALLNNATSINSYSESGNGIGYSYFRMRGIDQTRINYTVNGIPVNDPETQGYYFNNFADLMNSIQSVQIQRGVGTSSNGTASFAGSVNMLGIDLDDSASFGFTSGYGSFGSHRLSAEYQSGKVSDKFAFYGRVSNLATDGYRINSAVAVNSYYISGAYFGKKSLLKVTSFGGEAESQLAYLGTDKSILDTNRRYNPLTRFDRDKFRQTFHQLHYSLTLSPKLNLTSAAYFVKGTGYFDVYIPGMPYFALNLPDSLGSSTNSILRYNLNMNFGGAMSYLTYKTKKVSATFGVHANSFSSRHYVNTPWLQIVPDTFSADHLVHDNTGYKNEMSGFGKLSYKITPRLLVYADAQLRHTTFRYEAVDMPIYRDTFSTNTLQWTFLNPKAGFRYSISPTVSVYSSIGKTTREPTRVDLLVDDRALEPVNQNRVKPEQVVDVELGSDIRTGNLRIQANLYAMEFQNEIIATGKLNSVGYAMRENVSESFRRGLELDLSWSLNKNITLLHASSYSYNRIKNITQNLPVIDTFGFNTFTTEVFEVQNTQPLMTPAVMLNQGIRYEAFGWMSFEVIGKYVSKMYLDNTNTEELSTPAYFFADARASFKLNKLLKKGEYRFSVNWNNFTNTNFFPNGTANHYYQMQSGGSLTRAYSPAYYPAALSNVFLTLDMKF